jgi:CRP-like cAMP-binding protein
MKQTLDESPLFQGLSAEEHAAIAGAAQHLSLGPNDVLIREGDVSDQLFLLMSGRMRVTKGVEGTEFTMNEIGAGELLGEVAAFDQQPRSASVVALEPTELAAFPIDRLRTTPDLRLAYDALVRVALGGATRRLRVSNDRVVLALRRELEDAKTRVGLGSFLTYLVGLMCLYGYCLRGSVSLIERMGESTPVTVALLVVFAVTLLIMIARSGYPLRNYGLTLEGWRSSLRESLIWTAGFMGAVTLLKWIALLLVPAFEGQPLFSMRGFVRYDALTSLGIALVYSILSPAQEFIARGALQSSFQQFLGGRGVTAKSIALSTLLFGTTHLHMSIGYAVAAIAPGVFWGILYARQRTLLGVSVSHVLIGLYIAFFLGFPGVSYGGH